VIELRDRKQPCQVDLEDQGRGREQKKTEPGAARDVDLQCYDFSGKSPPMITRYLS
jgi:hypothetical protein